jgi:hypothetical protein
MLPNRERNASAWTHKRCWHPLSGAKHLLAVSVTAFDPIAEVLGFEGEHPKPWYGSVIPNVQLSR